MGGGCGDKLVCTLSSLLTLLALISAGSMKPLLPDSSNETIILCSKEDAPCFLAGDFRVNLQEALATVHTIWFREHNRIATEIAKMNPKYSAEQVFQISRQIVIAELQKITYKDYLPIVLGGAYTSLIGEYKQYDDTIDPSTPNGYDAGAGRFGHSQVQFTLQRLDEGYEPSREGDLFLS